MFRRISRYETRGVRQEPAARASETKLSKVVLDKLKERFGDAIPQTHSNFGDDTAVVARERILEVLLYLRDDPELRFDLS